MPKHICWLQRDDGPVLDIEGSDQCPIDLFDFLRRGLLQQVTYIFQEPRRRFHDDFDVRLAGHLSWHLRLDLGSDRPVARFVQVAQQVQALRPGEALFQGGPELFLFFIRRRLLFEHVLQRLLLPIIGQAQPEIGQRLGHLVL